MVNERDSLSRFVARAEILTHPVFERTGLSDVNDLTVGVEHEINAALRRQFPEFSFDIHISDYII